MRFSTSVRLLILSIARQSAPTKLVRVADGLCVKTMYEYINIKLCSKTKLTQIKLGQYWPLSHMNYDNQIKYGGISFGMV